MRPRRRFVLTLLVFGAFSLVARAGEGRPLSVAEPLKTYWKRARFECRGPIDSPSAAREATAEFQRAVVGIVEQGTAMIQQVNPDFVLALLARLGRESVVFSCDEDPGRLHARGGVERRGGRQLVALELVYPALLRWNAPGRSRLSGRSGSLASETVLHEFLHTIGADNLPPDAHNDLRNRWALYTKDVVYACSGFAYDALASDDPDFRYQMCRTCALARVEGKTGVSLASTEADVAAAERACAPLREDGP